MIVKQENVMYVTHSNKKGNTDRYNIGMKIRKILSLNKINNILYLKYTKVPYMPNTKIIEYIKFWHNAPMVSKKYLTSIYKKSINVNQI